ncbi:MAG: HNH endonuclease [Candidatus Woesearchaeota archaeon]
MSKTKIPNTKRVQILNRDGNKCLWCGSSVVDGVRLEVDHIISEHFGGSSDLDNLGTLCNLCNSGKSSEYYGNYLLSTVLNVQNIWDRIKKFSKEDPGICFNYTWRLDFYKFDGIGFQEDKILHQFSIDSNIAEFKDKSANMEIQFREAVKKASLDFKNLVKNFLFENKGFFELSGEKLVFKKWE